MIHGNNSINKQMIRITKNSNKSISHGLKVSRGAGTSPKIQHREKIRVLQ